MRHRPRDLCVSRGGESEDLGLLQGEHIHPFISPLIFCSQNFKLKETCGMERFLVSPMEEVDRGVEIGDEVKLASL